MKISKTFLSILCISYVFLGASSAMAEVSPTQSPPSLEISAITLDKPTYKSGEQIRGSFTITNHSEYMVSNLSYDIQIASDYKELMPGMKVAHKFLDATARQGDVSLAMNESQTIPFAYSVPLFLNGDKLGINIGVFSEAGYLIGMGDSDYIKIEGTEGAVVIKNVALILSNGSKFNLTEGPTIYEDKEPSSAFAEVSLKNSTKIDVQVIPQVLVYEQKNINNKQSNTGSPATLAGGESKTIKIPLSTMSYRPGVYFAEIVLQDGKGNQLASRIGLRYIIGGNIATVHSVSSDKNTLAQNEEFNFAATLTGTPFDIAEIDSLNDDSGEAAGKIDIKIFNEKNELIAFVENIFNLTGETRVNMGFIASSPSLALRVEMKISDDKGNLITDYSQNLSPDYDEQAMSAAATLSEGRFFKKVTAVGGLILLLVVIILLMIKKRISNKSVTLSVFILVGAFCLSPTPTLASCASAYVYVTPSAPYRNQIFYPGTQFYTRGFVAYSSCNNSTTDVDIRVTGPKGDVINKRNYFYVGAIGGDSWTGRTGQFTIGAFSAPNSPGAYNVHFQVHSQAGSCGTDAAADVPIYVRCAPGTAANARGLCADIIHGSCGTLNGKTFTSGENPSSSGTYCRSGTQTSVTTSGTTNSWSCSGANTGSTARCSYTSITPDPGGTTTTGGTTSGGGTTTTGTASCGTQNGSPVASGHNINETTSGLCASGSTIYGTPSVGLDTSSWRWMCNIGSESSFCSAACATGTLYCPATGVCSADCVDWCPDSIPGNPVGNQTQRGFYTIDSSGLCTGANVIEDFDLSPALTDSTGTCKALWKLNSLTDAGDMTCAINGAPVSCINTTGFGVQPGTVKFEVIITVASSTLTDSEELRCTQNPNVIEI